MLNILELVKRQEIVIYTKNKFEKKFIISILHVIKPITTINYLQPS